MRPSLCRLGIVLGFFFSAALPAQAAGPPPACPGSCSFPNGQSHLFVYPEAAGAGWDNPADHKNPASPSDSYVGSVPGGGVEEDGWVATGGSSVGLFIANRTPGTKNKPGDLANVRIVIALPGGTTGVQSVTVSGGVAGTKTYLLSELDSACNPFVGNQSHNTYCPSGDATYVVYHVGPIASMDRALVTLSAEVVGSTAGLKIHVDAFDDGGTMTANSSDFTWLAPSASCSLSIDCPAQVEPECTALKGTFAPTVTTTCDGTPTLVQTPPSPYAYACAGTPTSVVIHASVAGQSATCTTAILVRDTQAPTISCENQTLPADAQCAAAATPATAMDACEGALATQCNTSFQGIGPHTMNCSVKDCANNTANCNATITVVDTTNPAVSCPLAQTIECTGGGGASANVVASGTDNCGAPTVVCLPASGTFPLGVTPVTCTATDASANTASCNTSVTVLDSMAPTITCPQPSTVKTSETPSNVCSAQWAPAPMVTDVCDPSPTTTCTPAVPSLSAPGVAQTTCAGKDATGNTSSCTTALTLVDDTEPVVTCPAPQNIPAGAACTATAAPTATANDNCAGPVSATCASQVLTALDVPVDLSCTAKDPSNNTGGCTATVTLRDFAAPVVSCATLQVDAGPTCMGTATPTATATDNCGLAGAATCQPVAFSAPGESSSTCSVFDTSGNAGTCTATVRVVDSTGPAITFGDIEFIDGLVRVAFTVSDNCACSQFVVTSNIGSVSFDSATLSGHVDIDACAAIDSITLTLTALDCSNNPGSGSLTCDEDAAAITVSGNLDKAKVEFHDGSDVSIAGGPTHPAWLFDDDRSRRLVMSAIAKELRRADVTQYDDGARLDDPRCHRGSLTLRGDPETLINLPLRNGETARVPIRSNTIPELDHDVLSELQDKVAAHATALLHSPGAIVLDHHAGHRDRSRVRLSGDLSFGSPAAPAIVVVDPGSAGGTVVLDGRLRGYGTLVIHGRLIVDDRRPRDGVDPRLEWVGSVMVVGRHHNGAAELRNEGGTIDVRGTLAIVGNGRKNGSAKLRSRDDRCGEGGTTTVRGALLVLAGNNSRHHETAEVRFRDGRLTVWGVWALLGSRIKTKFSGERDHDDRPGADGNPRLRVRGSVAIGVDGRCGAEKFEFRFKRNADADVAFDCLLYSSGVAQINAFLANHDAPPPSGCVFPGQGHHHGHGHGHCNHHGHHGHLGHHGHCNHGGHSNHHGHHGHCNHGGHDRGGR